MAGPYLFSLLAFATAATILGVAYRDPAPHEGEAQARPVGTASALRWASAHATARFAVVLTVTAHAVMVMVMVMTPVHLRHHGMSLSVVGVVISLHILGMFGLSPVFGWAADRFGPLPTAAAGLALLGVALALGLVAAGSGSGLTAVALTILGLGWLACVISASAVLAGSVDLQVRVPLQGATDAGMNFAGAGAATVAGAVLAWGGFTAVNLAGAVILLPALLLFLPALRADRTSEPATLI